MRSTIASAASTKRIPTAGQLLHVVVRSLDLKLQLTDAMERAARRYYEGLNVEEETRLALHRELARAVSEDVYLVREQFRDAVRETLFAALEATTTAWNDLASLLSPDAGDAEAFEIAQPLFVLLVTVDLALRLGAIYQLQSIIPEPAEDDVAWAFDEHAGLLLERWRERDGLSVADIVDKTRAEPNTVTAWLQKGTKPELYMNRLATLFAKDKAEDEVRRRLSRHYALAALTRPLRPILGAGFVHVVSRLVFYGTLTAEYLRHQRSTDREFSELQLALHGVGFRPAHPIVIAISVNVERDALWQAALKTSVVDWLKWLRLGITYAKGIRKDIAEGRLPPLSIEQQRAALLTLVTDLTAVDVSALEDSDARARALMVQGEQFLALHAFENAARCFRAAASLKPENPDPHYRLGCALWKPAFEYGPERVPASWKEDVAEAERELWTAFRLAEREGRAWVFPLVELGWILLDSGRLDEALAHTTVIKEKVGRHTGLSAHWVGCVHLERGDIKKAIAAFEESLRADPNFELSREALADCRKMRRKPR
jgi:tetratricopeptide (TPR) repeat protein